MRLEAKRSECCYASRGKIVAAILMYILCFRHTSKDLEKSLQQSALGKLDEKTDVDSSKENFNSDSDGKIHKHKKEKKAKKHKKEKKIKKQKKDKHKKCDNINSLKNDKSKKKAKVLTKDNKNTLKGSVLKDETDDAIKTKSSTPFFETVKKLEKIEKLSLKVENEDKAKLKVSKTDIDKKPHLNVLQNKVIPNDNETNATSCGNQTNIKNESMKTSTTINKLEAEFSSKANEQEDTSGLTNDATTLTNNVEDSSKQTTPAGAIITSNVGSKQTTPAGATVNANVESAAVVKKEGTGTQDNKTTDDFKEK